MAWLAVGCPEARIVLAHTFGPKFAMATLFAVLVRSPSSPATSGWSCPASSPCSGPYADQLAWVCRTHGLDRVVWAGDHPFYAPDESLAGLRGLDLGDAELDLVLTGTATDLFGL